MQDHMIFGSCEAVVISQFVFCLNNLLRLDTTMDFNNEVWK